MWNLSDGLGDVGCDGVVDLGHGGLLALGRATFDVKGSSRQRRRDRSADGIVQVIWWGERPSVVERGEILVEHPAGKFAVSDGCLESGQFARMVPPRLVSGGKGEVGAHSAPS